MATSSWSERYRGPWSARRPGPHTTQPHTLPSMDLDVIFLGTGGSVPSARRNTAAVLSQGRRSPPVRLWGGNPAADAALNRPDRCRCHLRHSSPCRSLPGPSRIDQELRDAGPDRAADDLRTAWLERSVQVDRADHWKARIRSETGRAEPGRGGRFRRLRRRALRRLTPHRRQWIQAVGESAAGPLRPREQPRLSASIRVRRSGPCSAGRRSPGGRGRSALSR